MGSRSGDQLDWLRRIRPGGAECGEAVGGMIRSIESRLGRATTRAGRAESAWAEVGAPRFPGCRAQLAGGGVLVLGVPNASVRFRLDGWLRAGGLVALREASGGVIGRARVR